MSKPRDRRESPSQERHPGLGWGVFIFVILGLLSMPLLRQFASQESGSATTQSRAITKQALTETATSVPAATKEDGTPRPTSTAATAKWQVVLAAARKQIGGRYATIGDTPTTGFSCVGLVHWSFAQAGITVPESETGLVNTFPHVVGASPTGTALQPGDVLIFHDTGFAGLSHAAIYAGSGKMVSADSAETGIREEPVNSPFWIAHWSLAVRIPGLTDAAPTTGA